MNALPSIESILREILETMQTGKHPERRYCLLLMAETGNPSVPTISVLRHNLSQNGTKEEALAAIAACIEDHSSPRPKFLKGVLH